MNKRDYFIEACKLEEFRRSAWVISVFALVSEAPDAWRKDPYPYRLVQMVTGMFFVDPKDLGNLIQITDAKANEALLKPSDKISLKKGELVNLHEDADVTYGNVLVNFCGVIYPFGEKVPYQVGVITADSMEKLIIDRLRDTPDVGDKLANKPRDAKFIYVDEYLKFCDAMFYLGGLAQLFVPAGSVKAMTVDPAVIALRDKLIAENKDRLHDAATIAKIDAELVKHDKAWIKGDEAENFLLSGKSYNIVRKKLFLQMGAEMGLDESQTVDYIPRSLNEGWDLTKFPSMNNTLRAGSFNRGYQTMLGGESVKWLLRASSNMMVTADDCGSKLGNFFVIDNDKEKWVGFSIVGEKGPIKITDETVGQYLGKKVMLRSPMYCKLPKTDFCKVCVGDRLAANPTALSAAVAQYGNAFLALFMAAAHAKALILAKMDYRKAII